MSGVEVLAWATAGFLGGASAIGALYLMGALLVWMVDRIDAWRIG